MPFLPLEDQVNLGKSADESRLGGLANDLRGVSDSSEKLGKRQEMLEQGQKALREIVEKMDQGLTGLREGLEIHDVEVTQDPGATELGFLPNSALFQG